MADPTVAEVVALKPALTGGVAYGPLGSTLPTDATTALDAALVRLGYVTEDGLVPATDRTTNNINAWGGDVIYTTNESYSRTYEFTFAQQFNEDVTRAVFGDSNVTVTPATTSTGKLITAVDKGAVLPHKCWVFSAFDGDRSIRDVIEDGQITAIEEGPWVDNAIATYKATLQTFRGKNSGAFMTRYTDDGQFSTV